MFNIHLFDENVFREACFSGDKPLVEWLIHLGEGPYGKIDIRLNNNSAFRLLCYKGHLDIAKMLIDLEESYGKIDIHEGMKRHFD